MVELRDEFGGEVEIDYRFVSVFGSAREKLEERWRDKGGLAGYGEHVRGIVAGFGHVLVHDDVWTRVSPASSWPAHLVLSAVRRLEREGTAPAGACAALAHSLRQAFFGEARDIASQDVLLAAVEALGIEPAAVVAELSSGRAHAELAADYERAREQDVRMSPTLLMNDGRQRLSGNVGYRVIASNVREVLEKRADQVSWC